LTNSLIKIFTDKLNNSEKNKQLIKKLNEAFCEGNRKFILMHLADDIKWNIVGMPPINGKEDFLRVMEMMESAVGGFPSITIKNIISEGDYVVVENSGSSKNIPGKPFNPSYCEVYRLKNEKILELTTYVVDTETNQ